jgi:hypothetical protein
MALNFIEAFTTLINTTSPSSHQYITNFLWCLWKARNAEVIEGNKVNLVRVAVQTEGMQFQKGMQLSKKSKMPPAMHQVPRGHSIAIVDASWDTARQAGGGIVWYDSAGYISEVTYYYYKAGDPQHAEAIAVLEAVEQYRP